MRRGPNGWARRTDRLSRTSRRDVQSWQRQLEKRSGFAEDPGWYTPPAIEQFGVETLVVRAVVRNFLPESARMIHVASVHELVQQQIAHDLRRLKHEAAVQTDGSACRTASPARALSADRNLLIPIAETARAFGQRRHENGACALPEPGAQGAVREACSARISNQAQDPGRNGARAALRCRPRDARASSAHRRRAQSCAGETVREQRRAAAPEQA